MITKPTKELTRWLPWFTIQNLDYHYDLTPSWCHPLYQWHSVYIFWVGWHKCMLGSPQHFQNAHDFRVVRYIFQLSSLKWIFHIGYFLWWKWIIWPSLYVYKRGIIIKILTNAVDRQRHFVEFSVAILNLPKRPVIPPGHHPDPDSIWLPPSKSIINSSRYFCKVTQKCLVNRIWWLYRSTLVEQYKQLVLPISWTPDNLP